MTMVIRDFERMHKALEKRKQKLEAAIEKTDQVNRLVEDLTKDVNRYISTLSLVSELLVILHFIWLFLYTFMDFDKKHWSDTKVFFFVLLAILVASLIASVIFLIRFTKRKRVIMRSASVEMKEAETLQEEARQATLEASREVPYIIALSEGWDSAKSPEENRLLALTKAPSIEDDIYHKLGRHATPNDVVHFYNNWASIMTGEASVAEINPLANERKLRYLGRPEDLSSYVYTKRQIDAEKHAKHVEAFSQVVYYARAIVLVLFFITFLAESDAIIGSSASNGSAQVDVLKNMKWVGYLLFLVLFPLEFARSIAYASIPVETNKLRRARTWKILKPYIALILSAVCFFLFYFAVKK